MNFPASGTAVRGLTLLSVLFLSTAAFAAPDANKVAADVVAAIQAKGDTKAAFESASASGDSVTIVNLKITPRDSNEITVPALVIANPVDRQPGGFTAAGITFDGGFASGKDGKVTWGKGSTTDAIVPAPSEVHGTLAFTPFTHFAMSGIVATDPSTPSQVTIDAVNLDLADVVNGVAGSGTLKVNGINVPGDMLQADEQIGGMVTQLGYDKLNLDVTINASYDSTKDSLQMKTITLDGKDIGKLAISGAFGGLPRDKLESKKLREVAATATIDAATIRFDNAGVVERVLDMQAKAMGSTRDQFVDTITGAMPLMLSMINNPAFQDKVVSAATTFLKSPKSLTITAAPGHPVPVMQIIGAAQAAPQTVPDLLAVDIKANQ